MFQTISTSTTQSSSATLKVKVTCQTKTLQSVQL
jgi:hypothetical protein